MTVQQISKMENKAIPESSALAGLRGKLYLVSGGTGFLGSHLLPFLVFHGAKVRCYARAEPSNNDKVVGVEYCISKGKGVDDVAELVNAAQGVDGIFHLAGLVAHTRIPEYADAVYRTNVGGTMAAMEAARAAKCRIVIASTSGVIACSRTDKPRSDKDSYCTEIAQHWPYYHSKILAEEKALEFAQDNNVEVVFIRPAVMLGPGDTRFRSTNFICSFLLRKIPVIPSGGYAFVDVRDVAKTFAIAMIRGRPSEGYLLGALSLSTADLFAQLQRLSGVSAPKIKLGRYPLKAVSVVLDAYHRKIKGDWDSAVDPVRAEMGACYWSVDATKAINELSFNPRNPETTLKETIDFARKHHPLLAPKAKL